MHIVCVCIVVIAWDECLLRRPAQMVCVIKEVYLMAARVNLV